MLWIVPSQVSHGMDNGSGGLTHVDQGLFGGEISPVVLQARIRQVDEKVELTLQ